MITKFFQDGRGATSIEYALIASLIGMVLVVAIASIGDRLIPIFQAAAAGLG